jgi:hypothetical protein
MGLQLFSLHRDIDPNLEATEIENTMRFQSHGGTPSIPKSSTMRKASNVPNVWKENPKIHFFIA